MFYAIVENGGKQYKASEGQFLEVDLLPVDVGTKKKFDQVLLLVDGDRVDIGTPYLKDVQVEATVVSHFKGEKVTVFKYRPKQRYRVKTGHRQKYSRLVVDAISYPGMPKKEKAAEELEEKKAPINKSKEKPAGKKKPASAKQESGKKAASTTKKAAVKKNVSKTDVAATKKSDIKKAKKTS